MTFQIQNLCFRNCRSQGRIVGLAAFLLLSTAAAPASATSIAPGTPIPLSPTTFALPIDITGGQDVISWQFDLSYDAADVQVNTACDPFAGDIYCSLFTGPVTEGDFFAAGAPFNLLIPGFVDLDPVTLAQTGHLFGVNGAFGGVAPFPSGDGTLAFVEFTVLGNGNSPITVTGSATAAATVPEPGTAILLVTGLVLARRRRGSSSALRR